MRPRGYAATRPVTIATAPRVPTGAAPGAPLIDVCRTVQCSECGRCMACGACECDMDGTGAPDE